MPVGPPRFDPEEHTMFPLTLPGTGGSRVQGHESYIFFLGFFLWKDSGKDAAALIAVEGTAGAGNAKGVFYDN